MYPGKVKPFKGPKTYNGILKKIREESIQRGNPMSCYMISRVVWLFFAGQIGIASLLKTKHKRLIYVKGLGAFSKKPNPNVPTYRRGKHRQPFKDMHPD
jgi:hypothetical protein